MTQEIDSNIISKCGKLLAAQGLKIAFVESATAGRISSEFALTENSGEFLLGGLVCYNACIKEELLKVEAAMLKKFTPESAEVTELITIGLAKLFTADIYIGCTGLTAPGGSETEEKPVGTFFFHAIYRKDTLFRDRVIFDGTPAQMVKKATVMVAELLLETLINYKHEEKSSSEDSLSSNFSTRI
ncbi:MAG: CinA family protein [Flavobacteriales bacterium]|nr:MAG: CinA family protein [Flavobacteriales bacterium]